MYQFVSASLQPFPLLYLLGAIGLVALWRNRVAARWRLLLVTIPFVLLGIACLPVVGYLAIGSLEWRYPPQDKLPAGTEVIVVLSGSVRPPSDTVPEVELGAETLLRCLHAARLYHQGKPCKIVVSGGRVEPGIPGLSLAQAMRDFLVGQGVRESDLLMEDQSRTTYENAALTAKLLSQYKISQIVLVTSASHMQRAKGCFRAAGFQVTPSPCDYHATQFTWSASKILPDPRAAANVQMAVHEWLGVVWCWLQGRV
jgi:uncharacterized SAM-binding protein YcdF (DUF218 family)